MNSFLMPDVSGSLLILSLSVPAMQAAAPMDSAAKTPGVTNAASAPVSSQILSPAFSSSSQSHAKFLSASSIAALTWSENMWPPISV